jgi:hypothetical protein
MKKRCDNPANVAYSRYGGAGISYDPAWKTFAGFEKDMGPMPAQLTLERKDSSKNYTKDNCVWACYHAQNRNRKGVKMSMELAQELRTKYKAGTVQTQLAKLYGISQSVVSEIVRGTLWNREAQYV